MQIAHLTVGGRRIELKVPRMKDCPEGCGDGKCTRIDDAVREVHQLDPERPDLERFSGVHLAKVSEFRQAVLLELGARQRERKRRAVYRRVNFIKHVRETADVVLVAVG